MKEYRCSQCNKLLFKGNYIGNIEILCTRCKKLIKIECRENRLNITYKHDKLKL